MQNNRSTGVTILGWLFRIGGVVGFAQSMAGILKIFSMIMRKSQMLSFVLLGISILVLCSSILMYYIGVGLLKLEERARKWAIYISVFSIALGLLTLFTRGNIAEISLRIILFVIVIIYFNQEEVKEQFEQKGDKATAGS
jgi:uncharacterized membrane protein